MDILTGEARDGLLDHYDHDDALQGRIDHCDFVAADAQEAARPLLDHDGIVLGFAVQLHLDPRDVDVLLTTDGPEAKRIFDLAVAEPERLLDLAIADGTIKMTSPRGQKRGRGAPDDADGEARGAPRRATVTVEDELLVEQLAPAPSDDSPTDQDQGHVVATPLGYCFVASEVTELGGIPFVAPDELELLGVLPVDPVDDDLALHCHGSATPDAAAELSEGELLLPLDGSVDFTEDAAAEFCLVHNVYATSTDEDFVHFFDGYCRGYY